MVRIASPTGPQPITTISSFPSKRALLIACSATATGSVRAASSALTPDGTGCITDSDNSMYCEKPPGVFF